MASEPPPFSLPARNTGVFRRAIYVAATDEELADLDAVAEGYGEPPDGPNREWIARRRQALVALSAE